MMQIQDYIDSTYLKLPEQAGLSQEETWQKVLDLADEADAENFYAVMIRPNFVRPVKEYLAKKDSRVKVGTVIGFHEGTTTVGEKLAEARQAIDDGADDLDFVINFEAFKNGQINFVRDEVLQCTKLGIENGKTVKWIIEIAALREAQIADITNLIREVAEANFTADEQEHIFVKSSTGFYKTENRKPNGATVGGIKIMKENAGPLKLKAAGGVRSRKEAEEMIKLGVTRIGTSSAAAICKDLGSASGY